MAKLYIDMSEELYDRICDAAVKRYGRKHGNKKKAITFCLEHGIVDLELEIQHNIEETQKNRGA